MESDGMAQLRGVIQTFLDTTPGESAEVIAERVVNNEVGREAVVAMVASEIRSLQRAKTRTIERKVFDKKYAEVSSRYESDPDPLRYITPEVRQLFRSKFSLGDGTVVEWGSATVEQHEARISYLERISAGIDRTVDRHKQAIKKIIEAGVSCLDDIPEEELPEELEEAPDDPLE